MHEMSPGGEGKPVFHKSYMNSNQTEYISVYNWVEFRWLAENVWFLLKEVRMHASNSGDFCSLLISYHFVKKISADMH